MGTVLADVWALDSGETMSVEILVSVPPYSPIAALLFGVFVPIASSAFRSPWLPRTPHSDDLIDLPFLAMLRYPGFIWASFP